jgi:cell fate regulator YaaT (PSP1 superfamily)
LPQLVEIAFKGNRKDFFLWELDEPPPPRAAVIVEADRGEDLGRVHSVGELALKRNSGVPHGYPAGEPERRVRRLATSADVAREAELRGEEEDARRRAIERARASALVMKVTDAEWQWDRKKLTFYFTADKRVDFRALVRELATLFRTRIELKQIGVRDEAKRLDGVGRCGRQYCSASWLPELRPVNLGVAKDQRLSLNPSQISGACGRLMCSLRYEHDFYVQSRKRFPKEGRLIRTTRGEEKVLANDIFRERVTLRDSEGETRVLPLEDLRRELDEVGSEMPLQRQASHDSVAPAAAGPPDPMVEAAAGSAAASDPAPLHRGGRRRGPPAEGKVSTAPNIEVSSAGDHVETGPAAEGAPKRAGRRRGRRGGRRNRPGGQGPDGGATPGSGA